MKVEESMTDFCKTSAEIDGFNNPDRAGFLAVLLVADKLGPRHAATVFLAKQMGLNLHEIEFFLRSIDNLSTKDPKFNQQMRDKLIEHYGLILRSFVAEQAEAVV